jgi:hypothetical protein
MIEEEIKQTRCTTCDAEHPYKGGQAPRRKKKESSSALYKEVLAGKPEEAPHLTAAAQAGRAVDIDDADHSDADRMNEDEFTTELITPVEDAPVQLSDPDEPQLPIAALNEPDARDDKDRSEGPVHRPLIRATLPRPEGQKEVRNPPDFTIRQSGGRGNPGNQQFRGGGNGRMRPRGSGGGGQANGHRPQGGQNRFAGARPGQGGQSRGQGNFRSPQQPRHGGGNRKRSR